MYAPKCRSHSGEEEVKGTDTDHAVVKWFRVGKTAVHV